MLEQVTYPSAIGTTDTPATLTDAYTGNRRTLHNTKYFRGVQLNFSYTPAQNNDILYIQIETSQDGTNFHPLAIGDSASSDAQVGISADGGADSEESGIPLVTPKDGSSIAAQAINGWWSTEKFAAKYVRISAKDTGNGGTLHLQITFFT
jgi:hypothetical protein